jgi:hypothetical protein
MIIPSSKLGILAADPNVATAITFYIITVGLGNYLPFGWQALSMPNRIYDLLVHAVTPVLTLLYWIFNIDKGPLDFATIAYWLIYPLSYALYTAVHGIWTHFYPYDFTDVQTLGVKRVRLNTFLLSLSVL